MLRVACRRFNAHLGGLVPLPWGTAYAACAPGQVPSNDGLCELGADAYQIVDGRNVSLAAR